MDATFRSHAAIPLPRRAIIAIIFGLLLATSLTAHFVISADDSENGKPSEDEAVAAAVPVITVGFAPSTAIGGKMVMGEVTVSIPAPPGGYVVSLTSNRSSVNIPRNVTIFERETSATFDFKTKAVSAATPVTINATCAGGFGSGLLTLLPKGAVLSSLTVNPTSVAGGQTSQGTVTLTQAAPLTGAIVTLGSSNILAATVPATVIVPSGSTSANFTVNTNAVSSDTSVTINGSYGNVPASAQLTVTAPPSSPQFYVSPTGTPSGNGSMANPWDLQTALNHPPVVQPGATINLRGGIYFGKYISSLNGTSSNPITVRSYPGEWATIDGYATTTVVSSSIIDASHVRITFAANLGFYTTLDGTLVNAAAPENQDGVTFDTQETSTRWICVCSHVNPIPAGTVMILGGNNLKIDGHDVIYRDFEVRNSNPVRTQATPNSQRSPQNRGEGIYLNGRNTLVNLVIHDCQEGLFTSPNAAGSLKYGLIIYNNGYVAGGMYNGHGTYEQNNDAANPQVDQDFIVFNNFAIGIKGESQNANSIGLHVKNTVAFNNGSPNGSTTARRGDVLLSVNNGTASELVIDGSYCWDPPNTNGGGMGIAFIFGQGASGRFTNNVVANGPRALGFDWGINFVMTGNTAVTPAGDGFTSKIQRENGASLTIDNNTFYNPGNQQFRLNDVNYPFDSWKSATGYDMHSTYTTSAPTGAWTFVRPNVYQPGRANIIVYNWALAPSVGVNIAGVLQAGDTFEVRNVQDYFAPPVLVGTYNGGNISLPMTGLTVATPVGMSFTPAHTAPAFGAFVLIKR